MTTPSGPLFDTTLLLAARHQELQMWRAAQLVRRHVGVQDREDVLDCLGLSGASRPQTD
jgi:hypothetical protein